MDTQDYVIEYIEMNQILFGSFLDINKVIDRIISNLDHRAKTFSDIRSITKREGLWNAFEHTIYINPLKNLFGRREWIKPIIMHELDHCATTTYRDMEDEEKEIYIEKCLNNSGSSLKRKKLEQHFNKYFKGNNVKFPIVGIRDDRQLDNLEGLNEGITEYKNEKYCEFLGIKSKGPYTIEKMLAQFIAETIGEEKLISMHFNNDYEGIRMAFELETRKDLNLLVAEMNFINLQRQLSSLPLNLAKRVMIEKINNYRIEVKNRKEDTKITSMVASTDSLVKLYEVATIDDEDVRRAYETIRRTKSEREQAQNKEGNNFEER